MISIIVATDKNGLIGRENNLPWNIKDELKYFKDMTMHKTLLVGRKTFESINKPLPGRTLIIVTNNHQFCFEDSSISICYNLAEIIKRYEHSHDELMVIGGASIYEEILPYTHRIYLSIVDGDYEGNVYFPNVDYSKFHIITQTKYKQFIAYIYEKKR